MDQTTIVNLLTNSGLKVFNIDNDFIYFEDPSCIFPAFDSLLHYAWIVISVLTAIMLFGWGVSYIKNGVKINTLFNNAKTVILIFCTLSLVKPAVDFVFCGGNMFNNKQCSLFARQCEVKKVSVAVVKELLNTRNKKFSESDRVLSHETFDVNVSETPNNESEIPYNNENNSMANSTEFIAVAYENKTTIYQHKDGHKIKRVGGSAAWRNNNPGNIRKSKFAYENGAIGETDKWAVFPDEETGLNAVTKLLRSKNYNNLSVQEAIHRWAPFSDGNNPDGYARKVSNMTGLSPDAKINTLSDNDLRHVARAIQSVEGWSVGTEQRM